MKCLSFAIFTAVISVGAVSAFGQEPGDAAALMAEAEWDWRPGDLIFRNGLNGFDEAVRIVEGSDWASVGILRASSGGPRVVFVDESEGVTEVMLDDFIDSLSRDEYVVYRVEGVTTSRPDGQQIQGPIAAYSLSVAYGAPIDVILRFGNGNYYNAELAFEAAMSAGVVLGQPKPIADLALPGSDVWERVLEAWQDNPYCVAAITIEDCWSSINDAAVVTTGTLLASENLRRVYPQ